MAMKRTLLEMTSSILVSLDGDEVTTITDTAESVQIADIIRQNFYELVSNTDLPEHQTFFELTETSSSSPTIMTKPTDVIELFWVKYDIADTGDPDEYTEIRFVPRDQFFTTMDGLNTDDTDVSSFNYTIGSDIFPFKYRNDLAPTTYTTFDDATIVFNNVDTNVESYLRKTKTWCAGLKESSWTHSDSFVPALDHRLSNLLFQKSKAQAFVELKQMENAQTERKIRRAETKMLKDKHEVDSEGVWYYNNPRQLPNYGRK